MSPGNWVALVVVFLVVCWLVGVFVEIGRHHEISDQRARDDVDALIRAADKDAHERPRVKAISQPLPNLHRGHLDQS